MKGWIRWTCAGCVVALALGGSRAHAVDGTLTFSGSVLEPTCMARGVDVAIASPSAKAMRSVCAGREVDSAAFDLRVTTVARSGISDDRVLSYYAGYARALGQDDSSIKLVMQTFF
ncbi:hypothetical protein [Dyella solisilvae]|nr:hypothetical protein [Dyella solisilvae]